MTVARTAAHPLKGQVALVTGAGSGLGRACAFALADAGASLVVSGRTVERLEAVKQEIADRGGVAITQVADVRKAEDATALVDKAQEEWGRVDILLNNAGVADQAAITETTDDGWSAVIDTNVSGAFNCARAVAGPMTAAGHGKIVNMSSAFAYSTVRHFTSYSVSKAALVQLTRSLALELARDGVQVNAVAPGYFETDINAGARADPGVREALLRQIPARRFGAADELGPLVVFLASSAADYLTGQTIVIDGGWSL